MISSKEEILSRQLHVGVDFDRRTIYIVGEINPDAAYKAIVGLEIMDSSPGDIRIVLNSEGGSEADGYAIFDAITMCKNRIAIDGYGSIMSIAAAIFQAGDIRRMSPNSVFLIHNGSAAGEEQMEQNKIIDLAEQLKKDNTRYYNILSIGSQQPKTLIESWCREEKTFDAKEALAAGFVDEIIVPNKIKSKKYVEITLNKGKVALVDLEDLDLLTKYKWVVNRNHVSTSSFTPEGQQTWVRMDRFVMKTQEDQEVEHMNGNPLDNRKTNLRLYTRAQSIRKVNFK